VQTDVSPEPFNSADTTRNCHQDKLPTKNRRVVRPTSSEITTPVAPQAKERIPEGAESEGMMESQPMAGKLAEGHRLTEAERRSHSGLVTSELCVQLEEHTLFD
jgi:hypothetical protein